MSETLQQNIIDLVDSFNFKISDIKPSDYAEQNRVMSSDVSSIKGPFRYTNSPYSREIIDCLSPDHPARRIAVMKTPQTGISAGVIENGVAWIISQNPGNIMMISGDEKLSKDMIDKRLDQAIDSCGIRHLIRPNAMRKRNQRTGDTSHSKEFAGGSLVAGGPNNPNFFRQHSIMYGFFDDFDAAKMSDKVEGNIMDLFEKRFTTFATKMKAFYISTSTIKGSSNIEDAYMMSDQRKYNVPCPKCGKHIVLEFRIDGENGEKFGILFDLDKLGKLEKKSVRYRCQKCGETFDEKHKYEMLNSGIWVPTNRPEDETFYGYHINGLMLPPGSTTWVDQVRSFLKCYPNGLKNSPNPNRLKVFVNQVLGQTYEERGKRPQGMKLIKNTRKYKIGTIPDIQADKDGNGSIVLVTCACDLNGMDDDVRLDYEVRAWSENLASYSIDQGSIGTFQRGKSNDDSDRIKWTHRFGYPNNVWDEFKTKVIQKNYQTESGKSKYIDILGVDFGFQSHDAKKFVESMITEPIPLITLGIKGDPPRKVKKYNTNTTIYRKSKEVANMMLVDSNYYKDILSQYMDAPWDVDSGLHQPVGFMNFPEPADGKYDYNGFFKQFESEYRKEELNTDGSAIGYFWDKKNNSVANHYWDCAYYNIVIKDIFVEAVLKESKIKDGGWGEFCLIMR